MTRLRIEPGISEIATEIAEVVEFLLVYYIERNRVPVNNEQKSQQVPCGSRISVRTWVVLGIRGSARGSEDKRGVGRAAGARPHAAGVVGPSTSAETLNSGLH